MRKTALVVLLGIACIPIWSHAQARIVIQRYMDRDCPGYVAASKWMLDDLGKDSPRFRLVVACNDGDWRALRDQFKANSNTAFTLFSPGKDVVVLRGSVTDDTVELRRVLGHEIRHLRCRCALGED